jgi:hypothetical protein
VLLAGLDDAGLQSARQTWITGNGFRFLQLETYAENGVLKHAVIFVKPSQPGPAQFAQADMTAQTLQSVFNAEVANGFVPVNISAATVAGVTRFDALFENKNAGSFVALAAIPLANFQAQFNAQVQAHRGLAYIKGYESGGQPFVSAIWYGSLDNNFTALDEQSLSQMTSDVSQQEGIGRHTRGVTEYTNAGLLKYAGIWR